jgi:hypothetical protein
MPHTPTSEGELEGAFLDHVEQVEEQGRGGEAVEQEGFDAEPLQAGAGGRGQAGPAEDGAQGVEVMLHGDAPG